MKVYTTGEVSKICKVATTTVNKWFDSGKLPGFRVPGSRHRRIPQENLVKFLRQHGVPLGPLAKQVLTEILVVTRDHELSARLDAELSREAGYELTGTGSGFEAGIQTESAAPDVVVVDFDLGALEALRVCETVRRKAAMAGTIVIALVSDDRDFASAQASSADETFKKPFDPALLSRRLRSLLDQRAAAPSP